MKRRRREERYRDRPAARDRDARPPSRAGHGPRPPDSAAIASARARSSGVFTLKKLRPSGSSAASSAPSIQSTAAPLQELVDRQLAGAQRARRRREQRPRVAGAQRLDAARRTRRDRVGPGRAVAQRREQRRRDERQIARQADDRVAVGRRGERGVNTAQRPASAPPDRARPRSPSGAHGAGSLATTSTRASPAAQKRPAAARRWRARRPSGTASRRRPAASPARPR